MAKRNRKKKQTHQTEKNGNKVASAYPKKADGNLKTTIVEEGNIKHFKTNAAGDVIEIGGNNHDNPPMNTTPATRYLPPCHSGPQFAFEIGKSRIWGSKADDVKNNIDEWDMMIPLVGDYDSYIPKSYIHTNPEADDLLPADLTEPYIPAILAIDWPDFGVPFIPAVWWKGLVRFLETYDGDVVLFCQGGHGRTGTALTILACLSQEELQTGIECPLFWLRDNYCEHAVETYDQVDYIERITEMQLWSQPYYEGYGIHHAPSKSYSSYPAKAATKK